MVMDIKIIIRKSLIEKSKANAKRADQAVEAERAATAKHFGR